jgi:nucleoside diphosphate kinase
MAMAGIKFNVFDLDTIIVLDNEKRNKEIVNSLQKFITNGYSVCIWPEGVNGKDINDMILNGMSTDEIISVIDTNTYSGLQADFILSQWRKC